LSGLVTLTVRPSISSSTKGDAISVFHLFPRLSGLEGGYPDCHGEVAEWLKAAPC
jgi:hypothetical protein